MVRWFKLPGISDLREILNGGRKANNMNEDLKETLVMAADYTNEE